MRPLRRLAFWGTVAGVAIISPLVLNITADKFPQAKGLGTLRDYLTRRNG